MSIEEDIDLEAFGKWLDEEMNKPPMIWIRQLDRINRFKLYLEELPDEEFYKMTIQEKTDLRLLALFVGVLPRQKNIESIRDRLKQYTKHLEYIHIKLKK